jgi:FkbM family methyltransferase
MKMKLFDKILSSEEFVERPPVLIDIGASGQIHKPWENIRKYSICIAFDADEREFKFVREEIGKFKKLIIYNCIVTDSNNGEADFYLTKSPYCSSLLLPDENALKDWAFAEKFDVEKKVKIKTKSLSSILKETNVEYIDWFKTDSQGTDLRLFASLPEDMIRQILVAEFEPGILDSYFGEDKLFRLMEFMSDKLFWMAKINVKGTQRISPELLNKISNSEQLKKLIQFSMNISPGWAEVIYFNSFKAKLERREHLLGWIFATINNQFGFALTIAEQGLQLFGDEIFQKMKHQSLRQIKMEVLKLKFLPAAFEKITKILSK